MTRLHTRPARVSSSSGRICASVAAVAESSSVMPWPDGAPTRQPAEEPPPTSAASGGGSGTAELGAAGVLGADGAAVAEAVAVPDVDGTEVLALDAVVPEGFAVVEAAGEAGAWKSVQVSVRNVSPFAVTLNAVVVTVYFTPSLLTT